MVLYFLLDLPGRGPDAFLAAFLPRLRAVWTLLDLVQVRGKELGAGPYAAAARAVGLAVREWAGPEPRLERGPEGLRRRPGDRPLVLVNDRLDVALAAAADGVHLGASDLPVEDVRGAPPPARGLVVGLTCHTAAELRDARSRGPDYVGLGGFFPSETKTVPLADPRAALAAHPDWSGPPLYAIGGITRERLPEVLARRGVAGVVVSGAIQRSPDPAAAVRSLRAALDGRGGSAEV